MALVDSLCTFGSVIKAARARKSPHLVARIKLPSTTMKFLIVLSALAAVAFAKPGFAPLGYTSYPGGHSYSYTTYGAAGVPTAYTYNAVAAPAVVAAPVVKAVAAPAVVAAAPAAVAVAGVKTQYHTQDALGQSSYGHSEPFQNHNAVQDAHGNKVGSFSYVAPSGQVFRTDYVADALGYRVSSNALPVGPTHTVADTPEVAAAKAAHLSAHYAAHYRGKRGIGYTPASTSPLGAGIPAPVAYAAPIAVAAPVAYTAPLAVAAPVAYAAPHAAYSYLH